MTGGRPAEPVELGGLILTDVLGEGATGLVWRGRARDGTPVAVKVSRSEVAADPRALKLLRGEIRAMARLDHPNVLWVYDHGTVPQDHPALPAGSPYIVLEHCSGGTLDQHRPDDWASCAAVLTTLLAALGHAHSRNLVHRDLKPANVLWAGPGDLRPGPKLADFGVAHAIGVGGGPRVAGTPTYMAPEQREGRLDRQGPWTDLYALGVVAWKLLYGRPPPPGGGAHPASARFEVPEGLGDWIDRLVEPDPRRRLRSAADAWRALHAVDASAVEAPPSGWRGRQHLGPRLRLQGAGLGLVALREHELVGRTSERRACFDALDRVLAGDGPRAVVVRGAGGLGKTRFVEWLAARVREDGRAVPALVSCRGFTHPLSASCTGALRLDDVPVQLRPAAIVTAARELGLPAASVEALAELLDRLPARWGTLPVVGELMLAIAAREPLVLCFDDADVDEEVLSLARALLAERDGAASRLLLVLTTTRPEGADLGEPPLVLQPLSAAETERLIGSTVGLTAHVTGLLSERAAGHPRFVVDTVRRWVTDGVLVPAGAGFRVSGPLTWPDDDRYAATLAEVLEGAPDPAVAALERAAAQGLAVDEALWEQSCDEGGPGRDLRALRWRAGLVQRLLDRGLANETDDGFVFADPALVQALETSARAAGRHRDHHLVLARLAKDRGDLVAAGPHLQEAGQDAEALEVLLAAAPRVWAEKPRLLPVFVERAAALLERLEVPAHHRHRWSWNYLACSAHLMGGAFATAEAHARAALALSEQLGDERTAAIAAARVLDCLQDPEDPAGLPLMERVVGCASAPAELRAKVAARLGHLHQERGRVDLAGPCFDRAEALATALPRTSATLMVLLELLDRRQDPARRAELLALCDEAAGVARREGRVQDERYATGRWLFHLDQGGADPAAIRAVGRRLLRVTGRVGSRRASALATIMVGRAELGLGATREAAEHAEIGLRLLEDVGDDQLRRDLTTLRLACAAREGRVDLVDHLLGHLRELDDRPPTLDPRLFPAEAADLVRERLLRTDSPPPPRSG